MAITQTYAIQISGSLGNIHEVAESISADAEEVISNTVAAGATLVETVAVDVSQVRAFYIYSDGDVTVTTNSGATQTFAVKAGKPFFWHTGMIGASGALANPLTSDITEIHFHNAGVDDINVKAEFLLAVGV